MIPGEGSGSRLSFFAAVESQVNMYFFSPDSGQKPFPCQKCGAFFSTKSNCERHQLRKHGVTACSLRRNGLIPQSKESDGARDSTGSASRRWSRAPLAARPPFLFRSPRVPAAGEGLTFPALPQTPVRALCPLELGGAGGYSVPLSVFVGTRLRAVKALGWWRSRKPRRAACYWAGRPAGKAPQGSAMPRPAAFPFQPLFPVKPWSCLRKHCACPFFNPISACSESGYYSRVLICASFLQPSRAINGCPRVSRHLFPSSFCVYSCSLFSTFHYLQPLGVCVVSVAPETKPSTGCLWVTDAGCLAGAE